MLTLHSTAKELKFIEGTKLVNFAKSLSKLGLDFSHLGIYNQNLNDTYTNSIIQSTFSELLGHGLKLALPLLGISFITKVHMFGDGAVVVEGFFFLTGHWPH